MPQPQKAQSTLGSAPYAPASHTLSPPPVPKWVRGDPAKESRKERRDSGARNARLVKRANETNTQYDFVLYGDSITNNLVDKFKSSWTKNFGDMKNAAALGIGGNTVEELSWRLALGKEKFEVAPRCVAVLVGINNIKRVFSDPVEKLDSFLLPWMRATWPSTKIVLLGMLPNASKDVRPFNAKYEQLASKHGATYSSCGSDIDPRSTDMPDGTHPSAAGYAKALPCLRRVVDTLVGRPR